MYNYIKINKLYDKLLTNENNNNDEISSEQQNINEKISKYYNLKSTNKTNK